MRFAIVECDEREEVMEYVCIWKIESLMSNDFVVIRVEDVAGEPCMGVQRIRLYKIRGWGSKLV